jgi:hypothetical protein
MKVKDLKKELGKYDDDQEILIKDGDSFLEIREIDQIMLHTWTVFLTMGSDEIAHV